jgi:CDP-diacylglycerol--glycerol-3-phosphate 3-phosphatidyltransferase
MWTLPNLLSLFRLLSVPVLLALAAHGLHRPFLVLLVLGLMSDGVDGYLARRWNQHSDLGARLDSWADMATWLALPPCGWWLRPEALAPELPWLCSGLAAYLLSVAVGWFRFRRLIAYHTWGAKALSFLAGAAVLIFFAHGPGWVLRLLVPLVMLSALEEIVITCLLPDYRTNVPTAWHAWRLRKRIHNPIQPPPAPQPSIRHADLP